MSAFRLAIVDELRPFFKREQVLGKNDVATENISWETRKSHLASQTRSFFQHSLQFDIDKISREWATSGLDRYGGKRNGIVNPEAFRKF